MKKRLIVIVAVLMVGITWTASAKMNMRTAPTTGGEGNATTGSASDTGEPTLCVHSDSDRGAAECPPETHLIYTDNVSFTCERDESCIPSSSIYCPFGFSASVAGSATDYERSGSGYTATGFCATFLYCTALPLCPTNPVSLDNVQIVHPCLNGCIDDKTGECLSGTDDDACGKGGNYCQNCSRNRDNRFACFEGDCYERCAPWDPCGEGYDCHIENGDQWGACLPEVERSVQQFEQALPVITRGPLPPFMRGTRR